MCCASLGAAGGRLEPATPSPFSISPALRPRVGHTETQEGRSAGVRIGDFDGEANHQVDPSLRKSFKRDERASRMEDHTGPSVAFACGPKGLSGRKGRGASMLARNFGEESSKWI